MSEDFLSRWSRLKREGGEAKAPVAAPSTPAAIPAPWAAQPQAAQPGAAASLPLPPVESLEPGADIGQFMRAGVEESLKRQALRKLLQDPRFNVMDGLDVYIADFSKPDPLPEGWLEKMTQTARFGDYKEPAPAAEEPEGEEAAMAAPAQPAEPASDAPEAPPETPAPVDTSNAGSEAPPRTEISRNS